MSVLDEIKTIKGVTNAALIEVGSQNTNDPAELVALILYNTGEKISAIAGLGDFQQAVMNTARTRRLVLAHGSKLARLALTEYASPMLVSKQVRALLDKGEE